MRQITEPLTPHSDLILAQTTSDEPHTSNVTNHTLNYIYYIRTTKQKILIEDDKPSYDGCIKLAQSKPNYKHSQNVKLC